MKVLQTSIWVAMSIGGLGLVGCDLEFSGRDHHDRAFVSVQPQPQYVEQQPQYVVVQQAPPPMIVEQQPPPPPGLQIWIGGSWAWSNQRYSWQPGRYEAPPRRGSVWVAARYDRDEHGYRYTPGQWR